MKRVFCICTAVVALTSGGSLCATEIITTTAGVRLSSKARYQRMMAEAKEEVDRAQAEVERLKADIDARNAISSSDVDIDIGALEDPQRQDSLDTSLSTLSDEGRTLAREFLKAHFALLRAQLGVVELEKDPPSLRTLELAPSFQVNAGDVSASFVPSIEFVGTDAFADSERWQWQVLLSIKPDPPGGEADEVAQSIRINTGVITGNLGLIYSRLNQPEGKGARGVELRLGLPLSYQRAQAAPSDSETGAVTATGQSDFGIVSPELKISLWLDFALVGYRYAYYLPFGKEQAIYDELKNSSGHKLYMAFRIDGLTGGKSPFYLELTYTGGKDKLDDGTFSLAFSKILSWATQ